MKAQGFNDFEVNSRFQQNEAVERTRLISFSKHLTFSEENVKMIMAKNLRRNKCQN